MATLLEEAVTKNLPDIVGILMEHGVETNEVPATSNSLLTPAFLACTLGHYKVLKVLLTDENVSFASTRQNCEETAVQRCYIKFSILISSILWMVENASN